MGELFFFNNITKKKESHFVETLWYLYKNIDKYGMGHLYKVVYMVLRLENWDMSDEVFFTCGQWGYYKVVDGVIYDLLESKSIVIDEDCKLKHCPICKKDEISDVEIVIL